MSPVTEVDSRFSRLCALLSQDPENLSLLGDTAEAAFAEEQFDAARALLDRHAEVNPLPQRLRHLAGLIAMRRQDWTGAAVQFEALLGEGADAPPVRFNLAWSLASGKRFDEALAVLDDGTSDVLPQAAQLQVQLLHQLGEFDHAAERARALIKLYPDHRGLNAAVSTLALDVEDAELALETAKRAGDHPEALTTLGTLALGEDQTDAAEQLFDAALARNPLAPRALVGRGLTRLLVGDKFDAAREIDRGAEIFEDHIGSWIAAGWAYVVAGDLATAKARFEHALALDDSFAESQGSVAVIELLEGRIDEAKRRTEIALRLDRKSFAGAFATTLLAAGAGDKEKAQRIFQGILHAPIDGSGRTIAQSLARLGGRS